MDKVKKACDWIEIVIRHHSLGVTDIIIITVKRPHDFLSRPISGSAVSRSLGRARDEDTPVARKRIVATLSPSPSYLFHSFPL